jgi:hypothetical protein
MDYADTLLNLNWPDDGGMVVERTFTRTMTNVSVAT